MSINNVNRIKLGLWHKYISYSIWLALAFTGLYWSWRQDFSLHDPDSLSVNILRWHGILAALSLIIFGTLISSHIRLAIARKRNTVTGFILLGMLTTVSTTGYGLYYSPEAWHDMVKWTHVWLGLALVLILPLHIIVGHVINRRRILQHRQ